MRIMRSAPIVFLALGIILALHTRASDDRLSADERSIWETDLRSAEVFAERNIDHSMQFFSDDVVMLAPGSPMMTGIPAVRELYEIFFADPNLDGAWQPVRVAVAASGDLGYTVGTYQLTVTGPDGKPVIDRGKYVSVWRKQQDGRWKVAVDMFNSTEQAEIGGNQNR